MLKNRFLVFAIIAVVLIIAAVMYLRHSGESGSESDAAKAEMQQNVPACEKIQAGTHAHEAESGSDEGHEVIVKLKDTAIRDFGIETAQAQGGTIGTHTTLPAEITLNADTVAHIVPRVPGVVRSVSKNLGDKVLAGDVLAVIHSRELSDYKAGYLGAKEKLTLAQAMFDREKNLWEKKITAEQEYLNAKRDLADARIEMRSARQKLLALGFSQAYLENLSNQSDESFIVYEVVTPIAGTIIEKHITRGEMLKEDSEPFVVADLSNVWVKVNVHQKDLPAVKCGQKAVVKTEHHQGEGIVSYVSSVLEENTRTALARIVLPNENGMWRPGTFAAASIYVDQTDCKVVVSKEAIVTMEGNFFVFIVKEDGFAPQEVRLGKINSEFSEIVSGLEPGQKYAAKGAFTLKSELIKSNVDPCGGH
ncbi:MAG: efflux RND transporter periplasmic adaptor subunit [Phycisphaerae bacterium]|jgi:cobalt-zinc-cadmium efflux system membrane fusion protein